MILFNSPECFTRRIDNQFHRHRKQWFGGTGINDRTHATEGKGDFFLADARWLEVATGKRKARTKERMHSSSVIHCPGRTPYVFSYGGAFRIIQIIASEMIISDDHASVDLAALK